MCQISLYTEFQLPTMFCTGDIYIPTEYKDLLYTLHITEPFKCDNILKFYLLVSDEAVFQIPSSYNVPMLRYRPPNPNIKMFA